MSIEYFENLSEVPKRYSRKSGFLSSFSVKFGSSIVTMVTHNFKATVKNKTMTNLARVLSTASLGLLLLFNCCTAFRSSIFRMPQSAASNLASSSRTLHKRVGGGHPEGTNLSASKAEPVPGFGDDGCALPSPSKVNTLPVPLQAAVFFGYYLALYGGTTTIVSG